MNTLDGLQEIAHALEVGTFYVHDGEIDQTPAPRPPKWWLARDERTCQRRYNRLGSFVIDGIEIPGGKGKRRFEEQAYLRAYKRWYLGLDTDGKRKPVLIIRPLDITLSRVTFKEEKLRL